MCLVVWKVAVAVKLEGMADVAHEGSMAETEPFDIFALDKGHRITSDDVVAGL